ncbi:hypothetical protein Tco_1525120 [Tanacetum coccineum]
MTNLPEFMILSGGDNRPPMLDKDLYDSWQSRMELYMENKEHGRMILESVKHDPLIWPTIEENGVTRTKKYVELFATEKIQADCDVKVTSIILQGLPSDAYALVNHHRIAKDLWERIQLLMQVTSCFLSSNNQLRNSSNPRQQATIHNGRVTVQPVHERQSSFAAGEGYMARQCPKPERKIDATWFRDKVLLVEAQGSGKVLNEEELTILADHGVAEAKAVLMANLSSYGSDLLSEVPQSDNTHNDM